MAESSRQLEEKIRSARSFDAIRNLSLDTLDSLLSDRLAIAIFNIHLLGRSQIWTDVQTSQKAKVKSKNAGILAAIVLETDFEPLPFQEAIDFFRSKTNLSPRQFSQLSGAARAKAFTIAGGATRQVRQSVKDLLDEAMSDGLTLREFQSQAAGILDRAGISERSPWYWETVYRTNLGQSYEVGRWKQITDPDVASEFPYLRYVHADPNGASPPNRASHQAQHGKIYTIDDPYWDLWYPKNGFNCRCTTMSVSEAMLERRRGNPDWKFKPPRTRLRPDPGWEGNPGKTEEI